MNLSIFSFDFLRELQSSLRVRKRKVVVLLCLFLAVLLLGMRLLWSVFFFENFQVMAVRSLSADTKAMGIGSSRMFYGVDPRLLSGSYVSLAANYLDMVGAERLWNKFSATVPDLQIVFIELSVSTLFYDMSILAPQALQPLGLDIFPEVDDFQRPDHAIRLLLSPIFRWRLTPSALNSFKEQKRDIDEPVDLVPGFIPSRLKLSQPQLFAERKVAQTREHLLLFHPGIFEKNLNAAKRLAASLEKRRIKTVFLRFPMERHVWPVFEQQWNDNVQSAFLAVKNEVKGVTFLDLSQSPDFPSEEFRDPDHLNAEGAQRYSQLIAPLIRAELGN
jgi:hypothetical protein